MDNKNFAGFYKKSVFQRQELLINEFNLNSEEINLLKKESSLDFNIADRMVENVVSTFSLPLGFATNFIIDGKNYIIPMVLEEPSVVAAASNSAKISSGFITSCDNPLMIGQIQLTNIKDISFAINTIEKNKIDLLKFLESIDPILVKFGGGPRDIKVYELNTPRGKMLDIHLIVDVRDAMGANAINTILEKLAPKLEELTNSKSVLKIISNLAVYRRAQAKTIWTKEKIEESTKGFMKGEEVIERILDAYEFAVASPFRAATHNKGIMNGIDPVIIATGNDWRAIESGAHAFTSYQGNYVPLTKYYKNKNGDLVGEIDIPLAIGLVGGATKVHPLAKLNLKILGVKSSSDLARIIASVGLAENFASMRAIVTTGIQEGHMKLHAKNIAVQAGCQGQEIEKVSKQLILENKINQTRAQEILNEIRK
jgi:hydroxymethylglutaryl-CoA reductase